MMQTPQVSAHYVSVYQAASAVGLTVSAVYKAISTGELLSTLTNERMLVIPRASFDRWQERLFLKAGGTDDPTKMTLQEACREARCLLSVLYNATKVGKMTDHRNALDKRILDREEFARWRAGLAPRVEDLDPSVRWYTVKEIAQMAGLSKGLVNAQVWDGTLPSTKCRPTLKHYVAEPDFQAWMRQRAEMYPQAPLRGEVMDISEAARRYQVRVDFLCRSIAKGHLPDCRRFARANPIHVLGSLDVEEFLARWAQRDAWTVPRIARWAGLTMKAVNRALRNRELPHRVERHLALGSQRVVEPGHLLGWMAERNPPYRDEAAHVSALIDAPEAARLSGFPVEEVLQRLPFLEGQAPRFALDRWLEELGLPPSWQRDEETEWVLLDGATRLTGMTRHNLMHWIDHGYVQSKLQGGRRMILRCSLLEALAQRKPSDTILLSQASRELEVSRDRLTRAVKVGLVPSQRVGQNYMVRLDEVRAWLENPKPPRQPDVAPVERTLAAGESYRTVHQVAERVGMTPRNVARHIHSGKLRAVRAMGFAGSDAEQWVVAEKEVAAWIDRRGLDQRPKPGLLSPLEVSERYGLNRPVVYAAMKKGRLPATHTAKGYLIDPADVEAYLARRHEGWSPSGISAAIGLSKRIVSEAVRSGKLKSYQRPSCTQPVVDTPDLIAWMEEYSPAYRDEVVHLSRCVSSKVAGKLSGLGQTSVVKAIRSGELQAICAEQATGARYYIPRRNLDEWLRGRGLPPSWELDRGSS